MPSDYGEDTTHDWDGAIHETLDPLDKAQDTQVQIIDDLTSDNRENSEIGFESLTSSSGTSRRRWEPKYDRGPNANFSPPVQAVPTPLETFLDFFDDEIIGKILYEINLKSIRKNKLALITMNELKVFLGINIIMGYHSLPTVRSYWSSAEDLKVRPVCDAMSRDRFQAILSNLHVGDASEVNSREIDKFDDIKPLLEHLNKVFLQKRELSEHLSVGESPIYSKGRSSFKHYSPKTVKQECKLLCLTDDKGYLYKMCIYAGKPEEFSDCREEFGQGDAILSLLTDLKGKNHKIYMNNCFSSVLLMEKLRNDAIFACGTIQSDGRGVPRLIDDECLKRGDFDYNSFPTGITVYKWKDVEPVCFISNYHGVTRTTVRRKQKDGTKVYLSCPDVVRDYHQHVGGIDKHVVLKNMFGTDRNYVTRWHSLFFALLDITVVNSYIFYTENAQNKNVTLLDYYRDVGLGLLAFSERPSPGPVKRRKRVRFSTPDSVRLRNVGIHWPIFTKSKKRCEVCSKNGVESRPLSKCSHCGVQLCCNASKNCFREYHTE